MKTVRLKNGQLAKVDDEDFDWISKQRWHLVNGYVTGWCVKTQRSIRLHRKIMGASKGQILDHKNRDKLDNRRSNLRFCTLSENKANSVIPKNSTTGFKGVTFHAKLGKFQAQIMKNGKTFYLGLFNDAEEAASAYKSRARELFGEFSRVS